MAAICPFRGILYNPDKIERLGSVVVPPFDVISREEQQNAYESHPYNMIRLELNRGADEGTSDEDPHRLAAAHFESWLAKGILVQDPEPAIYLTATDFTLGQRTITRFGFICRVRLTPFSEGIVVPHEKTYSRVRSERLELMKASHANFSPIFAMYQDPDDGVLKGAAGAVQGRVPEIDFVDANGHRHRLWRLIKGDQTASMAVALQERRIYIADGHHRYETALAYQQWMEQAHGPLAPDHPARYVMMYLTAMETDGMVILPAHRLLHSVPPERWQPLLDRAPEFFQVERIAGKRPAGAPDFRAMEAALGGDDHGTRFGVVMRGEPEMVLLRLREGVMRRLYGGKIVPELIDIDVTVLTRLIFMDILGFDAARLDDHRLIGYASTVEQGVQQVYTGDYDIGFLLNPTRIEQVRRIADAGLIMPRKATYFYPKVISGLVVNSLRPDPALCERSLATGTRGG
ncbi:MAG: DUF1015 domain-containing protein [Desulfobacterales bacterium]|jgi:uncharacterized protein (DUF1015 family)